MRSAATVVLTRVGTQGLEVLLVKRGEAGDFPGLHVFPGGLVDTADAQPSLIQASARSADSADHLLARNDTLPFFIAAVREALEEVGVLLAKTSAIQQPNAELLRTWQHQLLSRESTFSDLVTNTQLQLATDQLGYFSHWITPAGIPRRYDTRFFVAAMPPEQTIQIDGREAVAYDWLRPADALAANERGDIRLIFPTIRNLETLAKYHTTDALLEDCQRARDVPAMLPKIVSRSDNGKDAGSLRLLLPGDAGYDEA